MASPRPKGLGLDRGRKVHAVTRRRAEDLESPGSGISCPFRATLDGARAGWLSLDTGAAQSGIGQMTHAQGPDVA